MNTPMSAKPASTNRAMEAERYYLAGIELLKHRKVKKAVQSLSKALELNPSNVEAQSALNNAQEALRWSRAHICKDCGGVMRPRKEYPEIEFEGFCSQCGRKSPIFLEVSLGLAELFAKLILFASFPIAIFALLMAPIPQLTPQGLFNIWSTLLEAVFLSLQYTPFFLILFLLYPPSWYFVAEVGYSIGELRASLHPFLFFSLEIAAFFFIMYLWAFLIFTPFLYTHRKGLWRDWERQKYLLFFALLFTATVVLRRLSAGVFY